MRGFETILPKRVIKQPTPEICHGGDCGPCVVSGLTGMPIREVYKWNERVRNDEIEALSWPSMQQVLYKLEALGAIEDMIYQVPTFFDLRPASTWLWGSPSWTMSQGWFNWMTLAVRAGYYGIVSIDSMKRGPIEGNVGDHWVMICGAREVWPKEAGAIAQEILISNSSRTAPDEEWVEVNKFLQYWGGFNALLARPAPGPSVSLAI